MQTRAHTVDNGQGWLLELHHSLRPGRLDRRLPPVVVLPGYGMNDFIFHYHPTGRSLVGFLTDQGREVWALNLRGQGGGRPTGPNPPDFGLADLALDDLPVAIDAILDRTHTDRRDRVDVVGCSLGCALVYGYLAHHPTDHRIRRLAAIAGPLRWEVVHPVIATAFRSRWLAGALPIRGARPLARAVLPIVRRLPALLSLYMTASRVDLSTAEQLVQTVEDPRRRLNREMAEWISRRDLILRDKNIVEGMAAVDVPVLCVTGNADGIVPPQTARSVVSAMPAGRVDVLDVGDDDTPYAHADLFISDGVHHTVFRPVTRWLAQPS